MYPNQTLRDSTRATRRQARVHVVPTVKVAAFRASSAKVLAEYAAKHPTAQAKRDAAQAQLRTLTGTIPAGVYGVAP